MVFPGCLLLLSRSNKGVFMVSVRWYLIVTGLDVVTVGRDQTRECVGDLMYASGPVRNRELELGEPWEPSHGSSRGVCERH